MLRARQRPTTSNRSHTTGSRTNPACILQKSAQGKIMRALFCVPLIASSVFLTGCIARTAVDVVTAPVKVVSKGVDLATTSQSEADEKRGRELRKREEELGKLERDYNKQMEKCRDGNDNSCFKAREIYSEIQILLRNNPVLDQPASE